MKLISFQLRQTYHLVRGHVDLLHPDHYQPLRRRRYFHFKIESIGLCESVIWPLLVISGLWYRKAHHPNHRVRTGAEHQF